MSTTIGDLVNRVYREYLEAPDDLESYSYLTGGINSTATTLAYDGNLFSSEEEDALGAGTVIEINKELMYTTALNTVNNEITVTRGARGTTKVAHSAGDIIKVSPTFTRQAVYDAIVDQIENLYPTLFAVETQTITCLLYTSPSPRDGLLSRMPRGSKPEVRAGKVILTNGNPAEILQPFNFGQVSQITFTQAAELQRMVQTATGAIDSAGIAGSVNGESTAAGISMGLGAIIKRHKRTLINFQESFVCLLYTSPSPRDGLLSRMPSSA